MALDAATKALMAQLAKAGGPPMHETTPEQARAKMALLATLSPPGPDLPRVEHHTVESSEQPVIVLGPENPRGIFVWWHGGGWVLGSPAEHETLGRHLAVATGCTVVLAGYRLAPEHRFPAGLEDALDALGWVNAHREDLAGPDAPIILAGDSAGANLATIVARHARDFNLELAGQVLVYPVVENNFDNPSYADANNQLGLARDTMRWFWDHYVDPEDRSHPDVSPARAEDLADVAPAVILTAEYDVLRTEGEAYGEQLRAAGVPVVLRRFAGQIHGFLQMIGMLPGSAEGIAWIGEQVGLLLDEAGR